MLVTYDGVMRVRQPLGDDRQGLLDMLAKIDDEAAIPMDVQKTMLIRDIGRNASALRGADSGGSSLVSGRDADVATELARASACAPVIEFDEVGQRLARPAARGDTRRGQAR